MKKTYINPEMTVYELQMNQQILAASDLNIGGEVDDLDDLLSRDNAGLFDEISVKF